MCQAWILFPSPFFFVCCMKIGIKIETRDHSWYPTQKLFRKLQGQLFSEFGSDQFSEQMQLMSAFMIEANTSFLLSHGWALNICSVDTWSLVGNHRTRHTGMGLVQEQVCVQAQWSKSSLLCGHWQRAFFCLACQEPTDRLVLTVVFFLGMWGKYVSKWTPDSKINGTTRLGESFDGIRRALTSRWPFGFSSDTK